LASFSLFYLFFGGAASPFINHYPGLKLSQALKGLPLKSAALRWRFYYAYQAFFHLKGPFYLGKSWAL